MRSNLLFGLSSIALLAASSFAGQTSIGRIAPTEQTQQQIASALYGEDFTQLGADFVSDSLRLRRLNDGIDGDDLFEGSRFNARAVAKFSGNSQSFGFKGEAGERNLFSVAGYGYDVDGSIASEGSLGRNATFTRSGNSGTHFSVADENSDGRDHLVTYQVEGLNTDRNVWVMFWEDVNIQGGESKNRTISDFNDLVVEVRAQAIPLPAAVWVGAAILGTAGILRNRLRRLAGV